MSSKVSPTTLKNTEKDNEIGSILKKMKKIKNQISVMRKQLRMSYDIDRITELENDRKLKLKKHSKLSKENQKLLKLRQKQLKEIEEINSEGDWDERKRILVDELRECKTQARNNYYKNLEKKKGTFIQLLIWARKYIISKI